MSQRFKGMSIVPGDEYTFRNVDDPTIRRLEIGVPDITTRIHHYEEDINASPEQAPNHPIICTEDAVREYEVHFLEDGLAVVVMHNALEAEMLDEQVMTSHRINILPATSGMDKQYCDHPVRNHLYFTYMTFPQVKTSGGLMTCMFPSSKIVIVSQNKILEIFGRSEDNYLESQDYSRLHELSDFEKRQFIHDTEGMEECYEIWRKLFDCDPVEESDNPGIMEMINSDVEEMWNALKEDIREQLIEWLACRQLRKRSSAITLGGFMPVFKEHEFDHVLDWAVEMGIRECPLPQDATSDSVNAYINGIKQRAIAHFHLLNNQYM